MQNLYNDGVISGQKRDEAFAAYKATEAQVAAAKSQYEMAKNGAREQEKRMAANNTQASKSAVDVVKNLLKETVQVAQCEGEVSNVYPKVGELVRSWFSYHEHLYHERYVGAPSMCAKTISRV